MKNRGLKLHGIVPYAMKEARLQIQLSDQVSGRFGEVTHECLLRFWWQSLARIFGFNHMCKSASLVTSCFGPPSLLLRELLLLLVKGL